MVKCSELNGQMFGAQWSNVRSSMVKCSELNGQMFGAQWPNVRSSMAKCSELNGQMFGAQWSNVRSSSVHAHSILPTPFMYLVEGLTKRCIRCRLPLPPQSDFAGATAPPAPPLSGRPPSPSRRSRTGRDPPAPGSTPAATLAPQTLICTTLHHFAPGGANEQTV